MAHATHAFCCCELLPRAHASATTAQVWDPAVVSALDMLALNKNAPCFVLLLDVLKAKELTAMDYGFLESGKSDPYTLTPALCSSVATAL